VRPTHLSSQRGDSPRQRHVLRYEPGQVVSPGGEEPDLPAGTQIVAVDLPGRAPADALARGEIAEAGLGTSLLRLGAARLVAGGDDLAGLVPEYVTLPRGVPSLRGEVRWSHDRR
jgi:hypothetical protein